MEKVESLKQTAKVRHVFHVLPEQFSYRSVERVYESCQRFFSLVFVEVEAKKNRHNFRHFDDGNYKINYKFHIINLSIIYLYIYNSLEFLC